MLESLNIRNIAIIDSAEIRFKSGLNILSGETGAGKSIVLEAISLILGSRASAELIRTGADEASVEGLFDISEMGWMKSRMDRLGYDSKSNELLIKRIVHRAGKHRIYINGELATLSILQELCSGLVDLCGQHEHQSLIRPHTQLDLLDRYGGLVDQAKAVAAIYTQVRELRAERDELQAAENERNQKADFLTFQIKELREADLQPGEDEKLQAEKQLLQSAGDRVQTAEAARSILEGEDEGAMTALRAALVKLRHLNQLDERVTPITEGVERAIAEAEEASIGLNRYLDGIEVDPQRMEEVQERLSMLADFRRKYGATVDEMLTALERLEAELDSLGKSEERLGEIIQQLEESQATLLKQGRKLSAARKKVSESLGKAVTSELKDLNMAEARFSIEFDTKDDIEEWTSAGADSIQYLIQTNRGEPARPLGKIASGGELSRLMLAIRRVIADKGGIGVYLFDEIDAGIGGQTAFQVGKKLKSVAKYNQVLCITHLPQVASFADHHLVVKKSTKEKRTVTDIIELSNPERKEELARMLGGPQLTKKSLDNAAELLELAR